MDKSYSGLRQVLFKQLEELSSDRPVDIKRTNTICNVVNTTLASVRTQMQQDRYMRQMGHSDGSASNLLEPTPEPVPPRKLTKGSVKR